MATIMITETGLHALLAWTSPAYPVGAFGYSHGLEAAVEAGDVNDRATLVDYVSAVLTRGGGWIDLVVFAHGWRAASAPDRHSGEGRNPVASQTPMIEFGTQLGSGLRRNDDEFFEAFDDIGAFAAAFRGTAETALESRQMGLSFLSVTRRAWPHPGLDAFALRNGDRPVAHAAMGALACALHGLPLAPVLTAWGHGIAANLVSAGVRLIPLGQTDGQIATAALGPIIARAVAAAQTTTLDDLGTASPLLDLASIAHETQYSRLFRS